MRLLLDTHVFLWALLEPRRLRTSARGALDEPDNELWLSPISIWECHVLAERNRVEYDGPPQTWLQSAIEITGIREAALTFEVAMTSRHVEVSHQDPADRFIAATAIVHELTLVTADARLLEGSGYETLPA